MMNDQSNMEEESKENNAVNNSALIKPGFINIGEERFQYGEQIQEQDEYQEQNVYLLGKLEEGYTLEQLCQDISENQRYLRQCLFLVHFSLFGIWYRCDSCYKMSDDKKVLYEYDEDNKSVIAVTYYGDNNEVYFTENREIINSLLYKHQVKFDDDVLIDAKNNIPVDSKSNTFMNENKNENDKFINNITDNKIKKNELQLEGYEPKTNNGCSCNLDCLEWCKQLF